jgi:predicted SprT family Zn-dependent metalloprotease
MSYYVKNHRLIYPKEYAKVKTEIDKIVNEYDLHKYEIEIEISRRVKRAAGNITVFGKVVNKVKINLSYDYYEMFGIERSIKTLRHEFAHLISYIKTGKMDHGYNFKMICTKLGGSMNMVMAGNTFSAFASEEYIRGNIKSYKYVYTCLCGGVVERKKRMKESMRVSFRHVCAKCNTPLVKWNEQKIVL